MSHNSFAYRAGAFVRSVLPAELSHWLILLGSTFLFISQHLRWWPEAVGSNYVPFLWASFATLLSWPLVAAGAAGYYACLLPMQRGARLAVPIIFFAGLSSLLAMPIVAFFVYREDWARPPNFALEFSPHAHLSDSGVYLKLISNLGPASKFAACSFALVAIFAALLIWGRAALPVRLHVSPIGIPEDNNRAVMQFVWIMICLPPLVRILEGLLLLPLVLAPSVSAGHLPVWVTPVSNTVSALLLLLLVLLASGHCWRETLQRSFHMPPMKDLGLGALIPAALALLWPLFWLVHDRILWSAHHWGSRPEPLPASYFAIPAAASLWYFPPALVEEIAWRGYLQPRFIERYGLWRGIFFIGIVWGAFHLSGDFTFRMTTGDVFFHLFSRPLGTVAESYALAWLTIRSRSVLPAALAHGVFNIFVADPNMLIRTPWWLSDLLWCAAGVLLLTRYLPSILNQPPSPASESAPEPAL